MAPGDVCHGPRCSLAGLGPVAVEYRSCHWPGGSAGSPQCVRPMGCWFFPVPRPPYVCPGPLGSCSPLCPRRVLCCLCGVLGHLVSVHRCARSVCSFACAVSWATWLLFTGVPARCVVLCVRCPGPPGSCSPVCPLGVFCCVCGVLGHLAPVHRCARSVCCFVCAVSWAFSLLFTGVPAGCVVLRQQCPGPPGSCSPVCPLGVLCCVCAVPPAAGITGDFKTVEQQDPLLSSQTITIKATRIAALAHDPPRRFFEIDKNCNETVIHTPTCVRECAHSRDRAHIMDDHLHVVDCL